MSSYHIPVKTESKKRLELALDGAVVGAILGGVTGLMIFPFLNKLTKPIHERIAYPEKEPTKEESKYLTRRRFFIITGLCSALDTLYVGYSTYNNLYQKSK